MWRTVNEKYEKGHRVVALSGADNGTRTRGLNLGKVALYQLSYVRSAERLKSLTYEFSTWQVQEGFRRVLLLSVVLRNFTPNNSHQRAQD